MLLSEGNVLVDLDGTLVEDVPGHGFDPAVVGRPIPAMLERVKRWLAEGMDVRIFTARVSSDGSPARDADAAAARQAIEIWCEKNLGRVIPVQNFKDYKTLSIYDDRAVQVERNTGRVIGYDRHGLHV